MLEYSVKEKYVGVVFSSDTFRVYEKHLSEKLALNIIMVIAFGVLKIGLVTFVPKMRSSCIWLG